MKRSRMFFLAALAALVLALASFLFSKETVSGLLRQRADEKAAEDYLKEGLSGELPAEPGTEDSRKASSDFCEEKITNSEMTSIEEQTEKTEKTSKKEVSFIETDVEKRTKETDGFNIETAKPEGEDGTFAGLPSYIPVEDEAYYERGGVVFTPEHAVGRIDCVLEIPRISLKRCVYSGTDAEIEKDLDMWFTVSASGSLVPGKTHYAIFGHNHTVQNLSFNRLAEVKKGDYFTLTRGDTVYIYLVTDLLAMERNAGRAAYAYDDSVDPALCYIFTCGRDYMLLDGASTRYKDFIVEGTLWKQVPIRVWRGEEETQEPAVVSRLSALRQELENAQEELRDMENTPVLTAASGEGSVPNRRSGRAGSFSWSMILLILTVVFSGGSLLLFLSAGICKIAEKEPRSGERGSSGSSFQITS